MTTCTKPPLAGSPSSFAEDTRVRVAFFDGVQDTQPQTQEVTWRELKHLLSTHAVTPCAPCVGHRCPTKLAQRAWAPVDIGPLRKDAEVRAVTVAVFDLDGVTAEQLARTDERLEGYAAIVHTTHGHRPGHTSLRIIVPLTRPVLPAEWLRVREAAERLLEMPADPNTRNLSRIYFLPNHSGEHEAHASNTEGRALDVDALLATVRPAPSPPPAPSSIPGMAQGPADLFELRAKLRRVRKPEHRVLIRRVLAGEPLAEVGLQDNTLNVLMSCAAYVLPTETPEEAVIEVFRPCFAATDWGEGTEHLCEQARLKLRRHRERRLQGDAQRSADNEALWTSLQGRPRGETPASAKGDGAPSSDVAEEEWTRALISYEAKDGKRLKNNEANLFTVLTHSPEWRGTIRFNEVTKHMEYAGGPLPDDTPVDELDGRIACWIQQSEYGQLGMDPRPAHVREVLRQVATNNTYDPLREYLEGLVWDGVPRADTLLEHYFGAQGDAEHLRTISGKWLISAAARALEPGCKVDTVLILEGPQGIRKSTAFRVLAGEWFCDAPINIRDKDSAALAGRNWQIELAEVTTLRASEAEDLKAFISRNEDTYRPPYGRVTVKTPRRCVFVGTTNSLEYLRADASGYRRWWPVRCTRIDIEGLKRDRGQLWAEAVARFQRGENWWLEEEQAQRAESHAQERSETDGGPDDTILQWVLSLPPEKRNEVTTELVARDALLLTTPGQIPRGVRLDIGRSLRRLGFQRTQRRIAGVPTWVYLPPENIRYAPQQSLGAARTAPAPVVTASRMPKA
ncbi:virulence-associated E family protein [Myxococcus sp. K38C18041901]|uniref:virulence-associated E family protein n=1 Tax=Myxococcus guangdongensis TaxID=2906760 RepID=UPI0020A7F634|nr:virulence-associated E family protein [Myxococcus guangdongensis]MCP3060960.1 virulence-associated E family protein [Myxococcus guangdongensis]